MEVGSSNEDKSNNSPSEHVWMFLKDKSKERLDNALYSMVLSLLHESDADGAIKSWVRKSISKRGVRINGAVATQLGQKVKAGDRITILRDSFPASRDLPHRTGGQALELKPNASIKLDVIYEDNEVVVINKQPGLVVHCSTETGRNFEDSLVNALLARYGLAGLSASKDGTRPGIVHRLDADTSGVLVITRTDNSYRCLHRQFKEQKLSMSRCYVALVAGLFRHTATQHQAHESKNSNEDRHWQTIDTLIGRHPKHGVKRCVFEHPATQGSPVGSTKRAVTHWQVVGQWPRHGVSMVRCRLETGRTHQIRVHMKHIHHPLLCDPLYGPGNMKGFSAATEMLHSLQQRLGVKGQFLHAESLSFDHPQADTGQVTFNAPLPESFLAAVDLLNKAAIE